MATYIRQPEVTPSPQMRRTLVAAIAHAQTCKIPNHSPACIKAHRLLNHFRNCSYKSDTFAPFNRCAVCKMLLECFYMHSTYFCKTPANLPCPIPFCDDFAKSQTPLSETERQPLQRPQTYQDILKTQTPYKAPLKCTFKYENGRICRHTSQTFRQLSSHVDTHRKLNTCPSCNKQYAHKSSLSRHKKIHLDKAEAPKKSPTTSDKSTQTSFPSHSPLKIKFLPLTALTLICLLMPTLADETYTAQFRTIGPVVTGSAVAHINYPLALPDVTKTFTRSYIALGKAYVMAEAKQAPLSRRLEIKMTLRNLRAALAEFITIVKSFVPEIHFPTTTELLARNLTLPKDYDHLFNIGAIPEDMTHEEFKKALKQLALKTSKYNDDKIPNSTKVYRKKRQIGIALMSLISLGTSAYSVSQLSSLHNGLNKLQKMTHLIGTQASENSHKLNLLITDTKLLEERMELLTEYHDALNTKIALDEFITDVIHMADRTIQETSNFNTGLSFLALGRLHPTLINTTAISDAFDDIVQQATKQGFRPIKPDPLIMFRSPISLYASKDNVLESVQIMVHIPLMQGACSTLYEYLDNPILHPTEDNKLLVHFNPTTPYLLLDETQEIAAEISEAELSRCTAYGDVKYCPSVAVMRKNPQDSCLFSLFHDREPQQTCSRSFGQPREIVRVISPGNFLFTTPEDITLTKIYFGQPNPKKTFHKLTQGTHILKLEDTVKLATTPNLIIKNHYSLSIHEEILSRNFTFAIQGLYPQNLKAPNLTFPLSKIDFTHVKRVDVDTYLNKLQNLETEFKLSQQSNVVNIIIYSLEIGLAAVAMYFILRCLLNLRNFMRKRPTQEEIDRRTKAPGRRPSNTNEEEAIPLRPPTTNIIVHRPKSKQHDKSHNPT